MRPATAEIPGHPEKWLVRKRRALRMRKRNRERQRRLKHGHRAKREARATRKLRHSILFVVHWLASPKVMYDSVDVGEIPSDAKAAAGYVGGSWPTFENGELKARCPDALLVSIAVASRHKAEELDIEPGDATPRDAPGFVLREHGNGIERPGVYAAVSEMEGSVLDELDAGGIATDAYRIHTAHTGAGKHICGPSTCGLLRVKADSTQWTFNSGGRNLDESVVRPSFWVGRKPRRSR
jgi:hypothetical protein